MKNLAPYIISAHIYWLEDSGKEPHMVLLNSDKTMFPPSLKNEVSITFNVSNISVQKFTLDDDGVSFSTRFQGKEFTVYAPLECIVQIHSKDGSIVIPVNKQELKTVDTETVPVAEKTKLSLIQGDNLGDGISIGKLSIV